MSSFDSSGDAMVDGIICLESARYIRMFEANHKEFPLPLKWSVLERLYQNISDTRWNVLQGCNDGGVRYDADCRIFKIVCRYFNVDEEMIHHISQ